MSRVSLDDLTLTRLAEAGSDMSQPHQVEFFLYFTSSAAAARAGDELKPDGFAIDVHPNALPWLQRMLSKDKWVCVATKSVVPNTENVAKERTRLTRLAAKYGGDYDGWGAPVVKG